MFNKTSNLKVAITELCPRIPWELVVDILESAEHTLGTTALDIREWLDSYSSLCPPGKRISRTNCLGGWLDLRACLDLLEKRKIS